MTWLLIAGMTLFGALGGLLFKQVSRASGTRKRLVYFVGGCGFYGIGAIFNIIVLRFLPYTVVFPLTSFTYIWTFIFSFFILQEKINRFKIIGLCCILIGAYFIVL